jgi:hypothetical protein
MNIILLIIYHHWCTFQCDVQINLYLCSNHKCDLGIPLFTADLFTSMRALTNTKFDDIIK